MHGFLAPLLSVPHEPESQVGGRDADRTTAAAWIADKVRHVRTVTARHDTDAAIHRDAAACSTVIKGHAPVARVGPLPDISRHVGKTVFVNAERPDWLQLLVKLSRFDSISYRASQRFEGSTLSSAPTLSSTNRLPAAKAPFFIGRQPVRASRLAA